VFPEQLQVSPVTMILLTEQAQTTKQKEQKININNKHENTRICITNSIVTKFIISTCIFRTITSFSSYHGSTDRTSSKHIWKKKCQILVEDRKLLLAFVLQDPS
jgi:hypothetical protein